MYNSIITIIANIWNFIGTLYAVLSIVGVSVEEIVKVDTYGGIERRSEDHVKQRAQAIEGLWLVLCGTVINCIHEFKIITNKREYFIWLFVILFVTLGGYVVVVICNCAYEKKYRKVRYGDVKSDGQ